MSPAEELREDEDLVVDLNAPPPDEKPVPVPGPGAANENVSSQVGLRDLERSLEAERREKERILEEARQLAAERDRAVQYAQEADRRGGNNYEAWVESQINAMSSEMDNLAAQAEAAMNDGDFKGAADINKRLGRIGGQLAIREREKEALAQQRTQQPQQRRQQPQQRRQAPVAEPTDPVEKAIRNRTEPTKNFLRKHPELVRGDGTLKKVAVDAHEKALDEGHAPDTEAYFRRIEQMLGTNSNGRTNDNMPQGGYSAPVTRGSSIGSDGAPGTFRMTPKMRRLAEEQGVTPQEWATNYLKLLKEGRITPIT